jgi:hypothetical protein
MTGFLFHCPNQIISHVSSMRFCYQNRIFSSTQLCNTPSAYHNEGAFFLKICLRRRTVKGKCNYNMDGIPGWGRTGRGRHCYSPRLQQERTTFASCHYLKNMWRHILILQNDQVVAKETCIFLIKNQNILQIIFAIYIKPCSQPKISIKGSGSNLFILYKKKPLIT